MSGNQMSQESSVQGVMCRESDVRESNVWESSMNHSPFLGSDKAFICFSDKLVLASAPTRHQCSGVADKNTWLKAKKAAGRVAGMHMSK